MESHHHPLVKYFLPAYGAAGISLARMQYENISENKEEDLDRRD